MSPLRAPATRPDRRDDGGHGRTDDRPPSVAGRARSVAPTPDPRLRPRLLRTSVLPALVASLSGGAGVAFTVHAAAPRADAALAAVLIGMAVLCMAAVATAAMGADRTATALLNRCAALRRSTERGQVDLRTVVERLRRGEAPPAPRTPLPAPAPGDELDLLSQELARSHEVALAAVVQASQLSSRVGNEQKVEVFVNLARRLQSLVHREIQLLDDLEKEVEDPELLKGLFHVDHLATRIRRHAENLAVLGGAISRRQWSHPVTMTEVLRSSIAEVEQYPRVKLVPPVDGTLRGHAVADVIHLLAELVENATVFSAPHTQVLLRAQHVTAGLAVEVEDRGLGMPTAEQNRMNELLTDPDQVNVAHLLQDGRIGLFVVAALARRHGIAVRLQSNIYGGVQAVLVLPHVLLGTDSAGLHQGEGEGSDRLGQRPRDRAPLTGNPTSVPPSIPRPVTPQLQPTSVRTPVEPKPARTPVEPVPPRTPVEPSPARSGQRRLAPLPVRTNRANRPNPAAARPGATHTRDESAAGLPLIPIATPLGVRAEVVRGPAVRPQLPRRRAQEHLVPQLRRGPSPRQEEEYALHDPGLMAAFRRGVGLAEAQPLPQAAAARLPARGTGSRPGPARHDLTSKE
ncbi:ATP-binding protein [Streptomyces sp. NPDC057638]|uniref:ATP-binding protein n=1 Tax=Streptomyces sp. NPDC057638 TaxID=3346190 RepID=UPI00367B031E